MRSPRRLLRVPIVSLIALLIFAATAAAEVRTGEGTSPVDESQPKDLDILKASAAYDSATGVDSFAVVTREAPQENINKSVFVGLFTVQGSCDASAFAPGAGSAVYPFLGISSTYTASDVPEYFLFEQNGVPPSVEGPASKGGEGTTTTLATRVPQAADRQFNCALVETSEAAENGPPTTSDRLIFPIVAQPVPTEKVVEIRTVTKTVPGPTVTVAPPAPAPAALSFSPVRPVTANDQKWTTVRLAVTNTGGTASGPVGIKVKAPKGLTVKPGALRLPALLPGQTWTVPVRVKATEEAKKTSSVTVTATLPGAKAASSFTVKSTS